MNVPPLVHYIVNATNATNISMVGISIYGCSDVTSAANLLQFVHLLIPLVNGKNNNFEILEKCKFCKILINKRWHTIGRCCA